MPSCSSLSSCSSPPVCPLVAHCPSPRSRTACRFASPPGLNAPKHNRVSLLPCVGPKAAKRLLMGRCGTPGWDVSMGRWVGRAALMGVVSTCWRTPGCHARTHARACGSNPYRRLNQRVTDRPPPPIESRMRMSRNMWDALIKIPLERGRVTGDHQIRVRSLRV